MEPNRRARLWDDGLHFTEAGYAEVGVMVGERLVEVIEEGSEEETSSPMQEAIGMD